MTGTTARSQDCINNNDNGGIITMSKKKKFAAYYARNGYPAYIFEDTPEEWEYLEEYNKEHDAWDSYYAEAIPDDETIESLRQFWEDLNEA